MSKTLRAVVVGLGLSAAALTGASTASAATTVNATPVTFVDTCGTSHDTYIVPKVTGVSYYVNSVKVDPGVHSVQSSDPTKSYVQVFTMADPNYQLGAPATWDHQYDATTGCGGSSSSASPSSSSAPSPSSSSASPSSAPTIAAANPAPSTPSTPAPAGSSATPKSKASTLPHTGMDMKTPAEVAGVALLGGAALMGGSLRRRKSED